MRGDGDPIVVFRVDRLMSRMQEDGTFGFYGEPMTFFYAQPAREWFFAMVGVACMEDGNGSEWTETLKLTENEIVVFRWGRFNEQMPTVSVGCRNGVVMVWNREGGG